MPRAGSPKERGDVIVRSTLCQRPLLRSALPALGRKQPLVRFTRRRSLSDRCSRTAVTASWG